MIYIFYKMLMFKMLNINECIFWCVCECVVVVVVVVVVVGGGGGGGGIAFIMSLQLLINSVWKCRLI